MVKVGERIVIPGVRGPAIAAAPAAAAAPRAEAPAATAALPKTQNVATAEAPRSARVASPAAAPPVQETAVKPAEPAGAVTGFRWPVRGRVIAGFGTESNGLQNDGINLAVPEGTPVKASEDGVVAYAGNELKGYGNLVLVRHSNGFVTAYAHASELMVKRGKRSSAARSLPSPGRPAVSPRRNCTSRSAKGATPVDPAQYLNGA